MIYAVQRMVPFPAAAVWEALDDVQHFVTNDPNHHDLQFIGRLRQGVGTQFKVFHTYWPIFPFRGDEVICTVTDWEPGSRVKLLETNKKSYRTHTQEFTLEPAGPNSTLVRFRVFYRTIPLFLLPLRIWVDWLARRRMRQKLIEIERSCAG